MANTYKYYRYDANSYRINFDSEDNPVGGAVLLEDGLWEPIGFGWNVIALNNNPISELDALILAGIKMKQVSR